MRLLAAALLAAAAASLAPGGARALYLALPVTDADRDGSIRLLVFDPVHAHRFVRRIALWTAERDGDPEIVRGIAGANAAGPRLFVATTRRLAAIDTRTGAVVWQQRFGGHCCDRFAVSPDGRTIVAPAFGRPVWYVVDAATGTLRGTIGVTGWPRDTIYSRDGRRVFLGAWDSPLLTIADPATLGVVRTAGPFGGSLCPFTVNAKETLAFANVDGLVGFEVGDLQTGIVLDSVAVDGSGTRAAREYECASHGIAFAPGERELWVADGVRNRLVVFDATVYPPVQRTAVGLQAQPRWLAFSADGRYVYPSTGDIIERATKTIVGALESPAGVKIDASVLIEIDRPPS
jgi:hypothetical protein